MVEMKYKELTEEEWRSAVCKIARTYLTIKECQKCGQPYVDGHRCIFCGDFDPNVMRCRDENQA